MLKVLILQDVTLKYYHVYYAKLQNDFQNPLKQKFPSSAPEFSSISLTFLSSSNLILHFKPLISSYLSSAERISQNCNPGEFYIKAQFLSNYLCEARPELSLRISSTESIFFYRSILLKKISKYQIYFCKPNQKRKKSKQIELKPTVK